MPRKWALGMSLARASAPVSVSRALLAARLVGASLGVRLGLEFGAQAHTRPLGPQRRHGDVRRMRPGRRIKRKRADDLAIIGPRERVFKVSGSQ